LTNITIINGTTSKKQQSVNYALYYIIEALKEDLVMQCPLCFENDLSVVISGEAGQGINTIEYVLTGILKLEGYNVFATEEFMSRVRGGCNSTEIRISSKRVSAFVDKTDILMPLSSDGISHLKERVGANTLILGEKSKFSSEENIYDIPFSKISEEVGGIIYSNIVACGVIFGLLGTSKERINEFLKAHFSSKSEDVIQKNIISVGRGYDIGEGLSKDGKLKVTVTKNEKIKNDIFINGAEAVGLGAIAGGCRFISSYPMSPSTGVLVFLSEQANEFNIISEQAEDEISAINMALGASYTGARSMVTTSGGGFALMTEGVSLAGMTETPIVIHLSQRPGPATGLPTRTEQGDLELALYSGHGSFPRIIFAPGNLEDAFFLTQKAFDLADKFQIPVFILSDQFLMDSYYNIPTLDASKFKNKKYIVQTDKDYKRYALTSDGISPRGIPGLGEGLVAVDSDEHDEEGHIIESASLTTTMVDKRLKKTDLIAKEIVEPELIGSPNYKTLIIGWGSTYSAIKESIGCLCRDDVAFLYFKQVYPLSPDIKKYLSKAKRLVIVENNATSQFGKLIKLTTGIEIEHKVLKYDGHPFSVEELVEKIGECI
jgi:2-oxoglutarate ferredoxin oxidoreductase subunit alpha